MRNKYESATMEYLAEGYQRTMTIYEMKDLNMQPNLERPQNMQDSYTRIFYKNDRIQNGD